jgi:hypothetical protein
LADKEKKYVAHLAKQVFKIFFSLAWGDVLFCFGKEECKKDSMGQLTKPLDVVWRWKNNKHDVTNTILVYNNVPGEPKENCIITAPIGFKGQFVNGILGENFSYGQ